MVSIIEVAAGGEQEDEAPREKAGKTTPAERLEERDEQEARRRAIRTRQTTLCLAGRIINKIND